MVSSISQGLAEGARRELLENILPFWRQYAQDIHHGGFIAELSNDLQPNLHASKGLILNTRILWAFSAAFRFTNSSKDAEMAKRAYDYLHHHFHDAEFGGYSWEVDTHGRPLNRTKKIYGQAFAIYALTEYFHSFQDKVALTLARNVFDHIERSSRDVVHGGYVESLGANWQACEDLRLSEKDLNEKKSLNNHLHLLEAYAALLRFWPDAQLKQRLGELVQILQSRILDCSQVHFNHFFDESWTPRSDTYTYGHDIEGSWLLCEAVSTLGDERLALNTKSLAIEIARGLLKEGMDSDGGVFYEGRQGKVVRTVKEWWPQAEAVVGLLNAWQLTHEDDFLEAAAKCWHFIEEKIVDHLRGEWYWAVSREGQPDNSLPKVSMWKCPYHNSRACLEIIRRINSF